MLCLFTNIVIFSYLIIWVPLIDRVTVIDYWQQYPRCIAVATAMGVAIFIALVFPILYRRLAVVQLNRGNVAHLGILVHSHDLCSLDGVLLSHRSLSLLNRHLTSS